MRDNKSYTSKMQGLELRDTENQFSGAKMHVRNLGTNGYKGTKNGTVIHNIAGKLNFPVSNFMYYNFNVVPHDIQPVKCYTQFFESSSC